VSDDPGLTHWAGCPIETMTREQLLVVIKQLGRQVLSMRRSEMRTADMHRAFAEARVGSTPSGAAKPLGQIRNAELTPEQAERLTQEAQNTFGGPR